MRKSYSNTISGEMEKCNLAKSLYLLFIRCAVALSLSGKYFLSKSLQNIRVCC